MTPWVRRLLIANVVMFFIIQLAPSLNWHLSFLPLLVAFRPWSIVTYMFLHADFMHLAMNMFVLFFFGTRLEDRLGGRHFLLLYFVSGITGAILYSPFTPMSPMVGASGAVYGVLMGYALYWPRQVIHIFGIIPAETRVIVAVLTTVSLYLGWMGGGNVAHFAHLGGFLGGFLYLKWWERRSPAAQFRAKAKPKAKTKTISSAADVKRWQSIRRDDIHPVNKEELDRILDKISSDGVSSLTPDEREFLDRFSAR